MSLYLDVSAGVNVKAGLGRYSRSLTRALLPKLAAPPTLFYNRIKGRSESIVGVESCPERVVPLGYKPWRLAVWMGQLGRVPFNRLVPDAKLFHAHEHLLIPLRGVPTILTVHDLIFKVFPEHHKRLNHIFLNRAMPLFVQHADAIITISEASKADIIYFYQTPPEKIHVIYEAAAPNFTAPSPEAIEGVRYKFNLPARFLLVVGTIEPRKNYSRLVRVLMRLRQKDPDLKLVVVGSKGWLFEDFYQTIADEQATEHVIFPGFVPDADLPALYGAATVAVMPSLYEGFGLPLLEAMACGKPVVSSNSASLPELGGDVPLYFDPSDDDAMLAALEQVLLDEDLQTQMQKAGIERARQFSWDVTAAQTLDVYQMFVPDL